MKRSNKAAVMALAAMVSASAAMAAEEEVVVTEESTGSEVTVGLDVVSAYVFRGSTFNDGFVAQPYVEIGGLPVTFGVWANYDIDDYDGAVEGTQFSEVDFYASYGIPIDGVDASIGYTEYTYPSGGGDADREFGLGVGLDLPLAPSFGLYYGVDGGIEDSLYADFSVGQDIELSEDIGISLGALVGYMDIDEGESGFSHYEVSAGLGLTEWLSIDVTYIGQIDDDVLVDVEDGGSYDTEFVAAVRSSFTF